MTILAVIPARQQCGISDYAGQLYSGTDFETGGNRLIKVPLNFWNCLKIPFVRADIVHLQHEYSIYGFAGCWGFLLFCYLLLLRLTGGKLVVTLHTIYDWDQAGQIFAHRTKSRVLIQALRFYGKTYHRLLLLAASRVIFLSEGSRGAFSRIAPWADPKKFAVIPIGVYDHPIRARDAAKLEARYGIEPDDYVFTLFGFAFPNKGYHLAIEAMKELQAGHSGLKLLIVSGEPGEGGAQYLASLKEMTRRLDLEKVVIFTGFIPFDDPLLDEALLRTQCFLYPYLKESATSGSLATTLAARKIYLTSDLEMFRSFTPGIQFRAGEAGDLAAKMLQVRQMDADAVAAYQGRLQTYLAANNTEAMRRSHLDCFVRLLEAKSGSDCSL
jgi:glycosyltransferase involved in cell wall biosynthesis